MLVRRPLLRGHGLPLTGWRRVPVVSRRRPMDEDRKEAAELVESSRPRMPVAVGSVVSPPHRTLCDCHPITRGDPPLRSIECIAITGSAAPAGASTLTD